MHYYLSHRTLASCVALFKSTYSITTRSDKCCVAAAAATATASTERMLPTQCTVAASMAMFTATDTLF
jgi:hypothetical protein